MCDLEATDLEISDALPEGYEAIRRGINVAGPTRDAIYLWIARSSSAHANRYISFGLEANLNQ